MTGTRSTSRTRNRNERDRAPMTIEARSATASRRRVEQRLLDLERGWRGAGAPPALGHEPAEVDDAPRPPPPAPAAAKFVAARAVARRRSGRRPRVGSIEWIR